MLVITTIACGQTPSPTSTPVIKTATPAGGAAEAQPTKATAAQQATNVPAATSAPTSAPKATSAPSSTPKPTVPPTNPPKAANLGDVVELNKYFIQAMNVEDPAIPGPIYQAESGKKLVAVELVVGNISGTGITVNPLNATLLDTDGFTYRPVLGGREGQIELVNLGPGERVRGWISFNIPNAGKPNGIKYNASLAGTLQTGLAPSQGGQTTVQLPAWTPPKLPKLGDVVEQDGYSLTAATVEDPAKPGVIFRPEKGKRLLAVEAVVGNVSGAKITVNPLNATLVDADGFLYKPTLGGRYGQIELVELNPGEKVKGWISFQIPPGAKPEGVKYNVSGNISLETGLTK